MYCPLRHYKPQKMVRYIKNCPSFMRLFRISNPSLFLPIIYKKLTDFHNINLFRRKVASQTISEIHLLPNCISMHKNNRKLLRREVTIS